MTKSKETGPEHNPATSEGAQTTSQNDTKPLQPLHFWVTSYPWASSILYATCSDRPLEFTITVYDCDGQRANELIIKHEGHLAVIELDPILGACKMQGGVKHAHLVIHSSLPNLAIESALSGRDGGSFAYAVPLRKPFPVTPQGGCFFPITITPTRNTFIALLNCGQEEAIVRGRFFVGKRSPEASWNLAPNGVTLLSVEEEFQNYLVNNKDKEESGLAYLRLGTKMGNIAAVLIERSAGLREGVFFNGVSG